MAATTHTPCSEEEFLARCEEELKDRFTEKDEAFMKVFNAEKSMPPIVESWWVPNNRGNDRRGRRRGPYDRPGREHGGRGYNDDRRGYNDDRRGYNDDRRHNDERRGYNDYGNRNDDRGYGYRQRPRY